MTREELYELWKKCCNPESRKLLRQDRLVVAVHPSNRHLIDKFLNDNLNGSSASPFDRLSEISIEVLASEYLPVDQPSGKLVGPDGTVYDKGQFPIRWGRFCSLQESDLDWAKSLGLIQEHRKPVIVVLPESSEVFLRSSFPIFPPKSEFNADKQIKFKFRY